MPKFLSQLYRRKFELNSELQVRNQKKREAETRRKEKQKANAKKQKVGLRNSCEISQVANFRNLLSSFANFPPLDTVHAAF